MIARPQPSPSQHIPQEQHLLHGKITPFFPHFITQHRMQQANRIIKIINGITSTKKIKM